MVEIQFYSYKKKVQHYYETIFEASIKCNTLIRR